MSPEHPPEPIERARQQAYIAVGRVVRPHGVHGNLMVEPISELIQSLEPGSQIHLGVDHTPAEVVFIKPHRERYLLSVDSCQSREMAETWRDQEIYLKGGQGAQLPAGTYYHWQIIGLAVETEEGDHLGEIKRILVTGANDVYLVERQDGKELLLPAIDEVIRQIDLEQEKIIVRLLPGLMPE